MVSLANEISNKHRIIAIMLGRLGLTADECIQAYRNVAQQAFAKKPTSSSPAQTSGAFSAMALENAIKQTIRKFCPEVECRSHRRRGQSSEKSCPHSEMQYCVNAVETLVAGEVGSVTQLTSFSSLFSSLLANVARPFNISFSLGSVHRAIFLGCCKITNNGH